MAFSEPVRSHPSDNAGAIRALSSIVNAIESSINLYNKEGINMPCPEKFRESLEKFGVVHTLVSEINEGHEGLVSSSPKKQKAEYFSRAMQLFDEHLDFESKCEILDYNACCKGGAEIKKRRILRKNIKI